MADADQAADPNAGSPRSGNAPDASLTSQATASPGIWGSLKQAIFGAARTEDSSDDEFTSATGDDQVEVPGMSQSLCSQTTADTDQC